MSVVGFHVSSSNIQKLTMIDPVSFPHGFSFRDGHVTTVEPGYYKEGEYGIRIENLYLCKEKEVS